MTILGAHDVLVLVRDQEGRQALSVVSQPIDAGDPFGPQRVTLKDSSRAIELGPDENPNDLTWRAETCERWLSGFRPADRATFERMPD